MRVRLLSRFQQESCTHLRLLTQSLSKRIGAALSRSSLPSAPPWAWACGSSSPKLGSLGRPRDLDKFSRLQFGSVSGKDNSSPDMTLSNEHFTIKHNAVSNQAIEPGAVPCCFGGLSRSQGPLITLFPTLVTLEFTRIHST